MPFFLIVWSSVVTEIACGNCNKIGNNSVIFFLNKHFTFTWLMTWIVEHRLGCDNSSINISSISSIQLIKIANKQCASYAKQFLLYLAFNSYSFYLLWRNVCLLVDLNNIKCGIQKLNNEMKFNYGNYYYYLPGKALRIIGMNYFIIDRSLRFGIKSITKLWLWLLFISFIIEWLMYRIFVYLFV